MTFSKEVRCRVGLVLVVLLILPLAGCRGSQEGTKLDTYRLEAGLAQAAEFAPSRGVEVRVNPSVPAYTVAPDLSNLTNRERFKFSPPLQDPLVKNGFVVTPDDWYEFFSLYESNRYDVKPNFVTTDSMLHNYHLFFNHLLKVVEEDQLLPALQKLNQNMLAESARQLDSLRGSEWENAARRNLAFFAVAGRLLDPALKIPDEVKDVVNQELQLIAAHQEMTPSPLMSMGHSGSDVVEDFKEDYTQYIPRGHYTRSEDLGRYFKTMMWYGRITFRQKDADETRSAVLMTLAQSREQNYSEWEKIYQTTSFLVGRSDDPGYYEYAPLLKEVYGPRMQLEDLIGEEAKWQTFMKKARNLKGPAINSLPVFDQTIQPDREREIKGFRFMGQRFTLDASIFQRLIYREVGENPQGQRRMLPRGLDIPAAMGSAQAYSLLKSMGETSYSGYPQNMKKMQTYIKGLDANTWQQNLYWSWLYTLQPLTTEKGAGFPSFMRNKAWSHKELNTYLASWTELKHDTILYSKQNYAEMGGGDFPTDDRGYVEPNPWLYSRLANLTALTRDGLQSRGLLSERDKNSLDRLEELALSLKNISIKELENQPLSDEEYELIRSYGGQLEHFWIEALRDSGIVHRSQLCDNPAALVADVATAPPDLALEEGTGMVASIYVVVPVDGKLRIAKGGVYTYYEFPWPAQDRLTDQKWREMLQGENPPARPEWTKSFMVDGQVQSVPPEMPFSAE